MLGGHACRERNTPIARFPLARFVVCNRISRVHVYGFREQHSMLDDLPGCALPADFGVNNLYDIESGYGKLRGLTNEKVNHRRT
ncbi:hypothetical protein SAMN05445850_7764 [Paraburkholderia tuberum]|uniref:Uncharacterized protein n=1 Tax=Paraburkholderia tuberum TaxID=157910 RepID=A0A1H1KGT9_9BURK|nr:hypothetical protein SAMN05445850_7764 [Paraburkholderia tuberum]